MIRKRATAIVLKGDQVLLIRRVKADREYWTLPGGMVEDGESIDDALVREVKEELSLTVHEHSPILTRLITVPAWATRHDDRERECHFCNIDSYTGTPALGDGPELKEQSEINKHILTWVPVSRLIKREVEVVYPEGSVEAILKATGLPSREGE